MKASPLINLGLDKTRMKDPRDVVRQHRTVQVLLDRFYAENEDERFELQILADEVGMGKTFVALAAAFSILEARRAKAEVVRRCSSKVLVLVPSNDALFRKWEREVGEFVKRCLPEERQREFDKRFAVRSVSRSDDLVAALGDAVGPQVIVAKASALSARLKEVDHKARITLKALFTHWSKGFDRRRRKRLLAGAVSRDWPASEAELVDEDAPLPIPIERTQAAIRSFIGRSAQQERVDAIRQRAIEMAESHFIGDREAQFPKLRRELASLYKEAILREVLSKDLPLVIVDEAHNWKNHRNNYEEFTRFIAPRSQRLLMMTATPFQLHPDEMLKILQAGDALKIPAERRERNQRIREKELHQALQNSAAASQRFSEEWGRLHSRVTREDLDEAWRTPAVQRAIPSLREIADRPGALRPGEIDSATNEGLTGCTPSLRSFIREALRLYSYNRDLSHELGEWVIRHRRPNEHRLVRVGGELKAAATQLAAQPGKRTLHAAAGLDVSGAAELPHYLLMRASSELSNGRGKASLGSNLTGCYSTLFASVDGRSFKAAARDTEARTYIDLLEHLVGGASRDAEHPKMAAIVDQVVENWATGDKSLLFCFRTNTAKRLHNLIESAISARLADREESRLGGDGSLERLRQRLTGRERDLIPIVLDRVLWSLLWARPVGESPIHSDLLNPTTEDYREIAWLALRYGLDLTADRVDRVFLNRAAECAQARRIRAEYSGGPRTRRLLDAVADESWVHYPYGITYTGDEDGEQVIDERGVHYVYDAQNEPEQSAVDELARQLVARDAAAIRSKRPPLIRNAFVGPSLWLGEDPRLEVIAGCEQPEDVEVDLRDQRLFHVHLRSLTWKDDELDWATRALAMQAVRRAALRTGMLTRILPSEAQREESTWAITLTQKFSEPLGGKGESLLRRLGVFLEDLANSSGDMRDVGTTRGGLFDASRIRPKNGIALVEGGTPSQQRDRYFNGFNTPLEPEVLICTSVGQEGIDLHRQCRHIVHYDLPWNPATLEQRTGRVDRIGSLAQRERHLERRTGAAHNGSNGQALKSDHYLEIAVPYLAGTYDERIYEELRRRAQTFEVLTGGELAPDHTDGKQSDNEEAEEDEGSEKAHGMVVLPDNMMEDLRVDLAVWKGPAV